MAKTRPGPRVARSYPISNPTRLRAALDWAALQASSQMVGLPDDHPDVIEGHDLRSAFTVLYGCLSDVARGNTVQLVPDPTPPPDEAAHAQQVPPKRRPDPPG
jgi:hypothetical protein